MHFGGTVINILIYIVKYSIDIKGSLVFSEYPFCGLSFLIFIYQI
jgi:hypothetical protein